MRNRSLVGIAVLVASLSSTQAKEVKGFDCWALGQTRDEVKACAQRGPYTDVKVTGGLETANGDFEGAKTNISFVFDKDLLVKIQVWLCEQTDLPTTVSSATRAWRYLTREFEQVKLAGDLLPLDLTPDVFHDRTQALAAALSAEKQDKFQLLPVTRPQGAAVWASVHRDPTHGYYVFLFFAKP